MFMVPTAVSFDNYDMAKIAITQLAPPYPSHSNGGLNIAQIGSKKTS
jgi:hypothetical protein